MTNADRNEIKTFVKNVRVEQDKRNAAKFVAQETGMSLASDTELTRLAGMETGAQKNKIEKVLVDGVEQTVNTDTAVVSLNLNAYAKKSDVSSALRYKGSKDTFAALPETGNENGDVWNIKIAGGTDRHGVAIEAGDNVAYIIDEENSNETGWDVLGGTADLSDYITTEDFTDEYKAILDNLVEGDEETFTSEDIASIFDDEEETSDDNGEG